MFWIKFRYESGREGVCEEYGKKISFETESEAADYAKRLNKIVEGTPKGFFPVWFPIKAHEERKVASK